MKEQHEQLYEREQGLQQMAKDAEDLEAEIKELERELETRA